MKNEMNENVRMKFSISSGLKLFLSLGLLNFACGDQKREEKIPISPKVVSVPSFSADSAYNYIQAQVDFGPRVPNTDAHVRCGDYLIKSLRNFGAEVEVQSFESTAYDGTRYQLRNIIGSYNTDATKRILLAAHWDTRRFADKDDQRTQEPIDGANDGGSGVAVLLEIGRVINSAGPDVGVDIIFFDGEDNGTEEGYEGNVLSENPEHNGWCLGSQYWSRNKHSKSYTAYYGILLDMVGAKGAKFYREKGSMSYAPGIVKKVWDKGNELGYSRYFVYKDGGEVTDDHLFVYHWGKIQMIDIIEYNEDTFFGSYHHTHKDNMNIIDKNTLQAVGETVLNVIYYE